MKRIAALYLCIITLLCTSACSCSHEWKEATCTEPKTCAMCGITEGEVLAHQWVAATCIEPKTCFTCKATEHEPNGHKWVEATCIVPKYCEVCGLEESSAPGHVLAETTRAREPSCTEPGINEGVCTVCNTVLSEEIPMIEHTPGEWEISVEATYETSGKKYILCSVCSGVLREETYELTEEEKEAWFKNACEKLSYEDVARNADNYIGSRVMFTGEVSTILEEAEKGNGISVYYVYTKNAYPESSYGFYIGDPVYVEVDSSSNRILKGDIITFYGEVDGLYDYTGMGKQPKINVLYYDIKGSIMSVFGVE